MPEHYPQTSLRVSPTSFDGASTAKGTNRDNELFDELAVSAAELLVSLRRGGELRRVALLRIQGEGMIIGA
jgi:hypothetical protein